MAGIVGSSGSGVSRRLSPSNRNGTIMESIK